MPKTTQQRIRADLRHSYLLLGLLVVVLGAAAAFLVGERVLYLREAHDRDSHYHQQTMLLCGGIKEHLLAIQVHLAEEGTWNGAGDAETVATLQLTRSAFDALDRLHQHYLAPRMTLAVERLGKTQRRLEDLNAMRSPVPVADIASDLDRAILRAEQLRRLHQGGHNELQAAVRHTTTAWLWKLTALAGFALLIGAIVLWRIFDRSDRAIDSWQRADAERDRLYAALDASFSEAYLVDPTTLQITHASRGAASALGMPSEELQTLRMVDVAPTLDAAAITAVAAGERRTLLLETEHRRANGSVYPVQISVQRIEQDGVARLLLVAMDVSDLREARIALHQAQKVEAAGQIAGGLAHDFNNLIMVIEGHAELLRLQRSTPALRAISDAAARAGALTKQLLQFSRKTLVQPVVLDLNGILEDVKYLLGRLINANIDTRFEPSTAPAIVKADRGQIQQVLLNLCINAQDAMPSGGVLTLAAGRARRTAGPATAWTDDPDGDHAWVRVSDTGVGIDADTLQHVFEPFYTTKPVGRGTGLGLASVSAIATESGGFVDVQTEVGAGSAFTVYLPRSDAAPEEYLPASDEPHVGRGNEMILVVDDDDLVADLIEDVLQRKGYRVLVASTPSEALRLAEEHADALRLVITDLVMPEMTGDELAQRIRGTHPGVGFVYISGYAPERVIPERRLDEELTFLQKPFPPRELLRAVRRVLDSRT